MPEVDTRADIETIFARARAAADELVQDDMGLYHRQVVFVTPGRLLVGETCPLPGVIPADELERFKILVPSIPTLNIAVIAYTFIEALQADIQQAIPFFGYLLGFAILGHRVWVFEGHTNALEAGCRDADMMLVDEGMVPHLEAGWRETAEKAMRGTAVKLISRTGIDPAAITERWS